MTHASATIVPVQSCNPTRIIAAWLVAVIPALRIISLFEQPVPTSA